MNQRIKMKMVASILIIQVIAIVVAFAQTTPNAPIETYYKIRQVLLPDERRPAVEYNMKQLPFKNAGGQLPSYDGENFHININGQNIKSAEEAKRMVSSFLESLQSPLKMDKELRMNINANSSKADTKYIQDQIAKGKQATKDRVKKDLKDVSKSSESMLDELGADLMKQSSVIITVYRFDEYFSDVIIDNTSIDINSRTENELVSIHGKFYNMVNVTNKKPLTLKDAMTKALAAIKAENKLENINGSDKGEIVLLPYAEGFKYAWKTEVTAEGPYGVWIDAETGMVLQLLPHFLFSDNAKGLVFNPSPTQGTTEMTFEVDPSSGGKYTLNLAGVITLTNNGGDGSSGIVQITDDGSGTANFNAAPINGIVVERKNMAGYNAQFQQVNIYAHVFNERKYYMLLGSNAFPTLNINFNIAGNNSFCCPLRYFTGSTTLASSAGTCTGPCNLDLATDCYNAGIDATVIAHEFGHQLNEIQYKGGVGGFVMPSQLHEGMADYWACTNFNMNTFAGWWAHDCPAPTQSGMAPRQAEATDIFPDRTTGCASWEGHSAGQIICWANFGSRENMNDATTFGTLSMNLNLIKAMFATTYTSGGTAKTTHDSYVALLQQMAPLYKTSRLIHKLLAGYARAGIFLSSKDAIIDIDHSYLDRTSATPPVFTVWTGDDYTFSGSSVVTTGTLPFNTQVMIEVANDEAFTSNLRSSGWIGGVTASAGGSRTWSLSAADWTTLKAGTDLYYRVTTKDAGGGNLRYSWEPGNNFIGVDVPVGRAAINGTGTKDCSCSAASASVSSAMALIPLIPLSFLVIYRRRLAKRRRDL